MSNDVIDLDAARRRRAPHGDDERPVAERERDMLRELVTSMFKLTALQVGELALGANIEACRERGEFLLELGALVSKRATQIQVPPTLRPPEAT